MLGWVVYLCLYSIGGGEPVHHTEGLKRVGGVIQPGCEHSQGKVLYMPCQHGSGSPAPGHHTVVHFNNPEQFKLATIVAVQMIQNIPWLETGCNWKTANSLVPADFYICCTSSLIYFDFLLLYSSLCFRETHPKECVATKINIINSSSRRD